jgi:hypothetical protein
MPGYGHTFIPEHCWATRTKRRRDRGISTSLKDQEYQYVPECGKENQHFPEDQEYRTTLTGQ